MTNSQAGQADSGQQTVERARAPFTTGVHLEPDSIIFERYKVVKLLGRGGMGSVYHVRHLHLQSDYALKVLDAQSNESTWRRFENEARAANRLDHPNLIKVHDSGLLPDGQPFFVMELVPGITLADLLKKKGRLPVPQALSIFIQVGFALSYAHENGVIHRDLKPSNIMLIENSAGSLYSSVKLVDLGIAKLTGVDEFNQQTLTKTGEIFGSPLYMSPEQCMGIAVDRRADLYSFGCVMYETLTGAPPIMGDNALSTMMKHQSEKPLSLKEASLGIEFPQAIEQLVANLLEKDPNARYSDAQLLTAALVNTQQTLQESSETKDSTFAGSDFLKTVSAQKKNLFRWQNIASAVLIIGAYALGYLHGTSTNEPAPSLTVKPKPRLKAPIRVLEEGLSTIPLIDDLMEGKESKDSDPYLGTGKEFFSTAKDGKKIFKFPSRQSIGMIGIYDQAGEKYWQSAQSNVVLPSGLLSFQANSLLFLHPRLLRKFRPGELGALSLRNAQRNSHELLSILPQQPHIIQLDLSGTWAEKEEIEKIGKLPKLTRLYLAGSQADSTVVAVMPNLLQLYDLDLTEMQNISAVLKKLQNTKALCSLSMKRCQLTLDNIKTIAKIPSVKVLNFQNNKNFNDQCLKELLPLKGLCVLNLDGCNIGARSIDTLKKFPLTHLEIGEAQFNEHEIQLLKQALPQAKVVVLKRNKEDDYHYINSGLGKL